MVTGDFNDCLARIDAVLPPWFGADLTPILTGTIAAYAEVGTILFGEATYVQMQMRISTATGPNLDQIALDFFGFNKFQRGQGEGDVSYRNRILASLIRERATRRGMINVLTLLTGRAPRIFVPGTPMDGGGYSLGGVGYGVAGGYSNHNPAYTAYQCFITVFSPVVSSVAAVPGYNTSASAWGGHGSRSSWSSKDNFTNALNAAQIYQAINDTKCEGTVCWTQIVNP